jgi:hypothetical protein
LRWASARRGLPVVPSGAGLGSVEVPRAGVTKKLLA